MNDSPLNTWRVYEILDDEGYWRHDFVGKVTLDPNDHEGEFDEPMVTLWSPIKVDIATDVRYRPHWTDTYTVRYDRTRPAYDRDVEPLLDHYDRQRAEAQVLLSDATAMLAELGAVAAEAE